MPALPPPSLKGRALRLLSRREYSRAELQQRLQPYEEQPGTLAQALDELEAKGFISAQRVLESVVHRRAPRLGAARIKQELQAKGLDAQAVADAVHQLRSTELERAREVWRKKFKEPATDPAPRAKHMRFLASRGFSAEVIGRVVRGGEDE